MTTWDEARALAETELRPQWRHDSGTFYVAPWGYQDAEVFQVIVGAREWLEGGQSAYADEDGPIVLVEKDTGTIILSSWFLEEERLKAMDPVGEGHPE